MEEYAAISKGNIRFEFYVPDSDEELEKEAQKSGVQPVQLQVIEKDEAVVKKVFMGVAIYFEDKREVIPVVLSTTGLEYEITTRIKKLVEKNKKFVGIINLDDEVQTNTFSQILRQRYEVRPIDLVNDIPNNINVLILTGVKDSLDVNHYSNLKSFMEKGGNTFVALNPISVDLQTQKAEVFKFPPTETVTPVASLVPPMVEKKPAPLTTVVPSVSYTHLTLPTSDLV